MVVPTWLLLTYKVPPEPATKRVALWRRLKGTSVFVDLPAPVTETLASSVPSRRLKSAASLSRGAAAAPAIVVPNSTAAVVASAVGGHFRGDRAAIERTLRHIQMRAFPSATVRVVATGPAKTFP
jgi:hypothetical protein